MNLLHGDLGISYQDPATRVTDIIARAWPVTASVGITALAVSVFLGTGAGIVKAVSRRRCVKEMISAAGMLSSRDSELCGGNLPSPCVQCEAEMAAGFRAVKPGSLYTSCDGAFPVPFGNDCEADCKRP